MLIIGRLKPGSAMVQAVPTAEDRVRVQRGPCGIKLHWGGIFSGYFGFLQSVLHHCHQRGGQWVRRRSYIHIDETVFGGLENDTRRLSQSMRQVGHVCAFFA
jgi:hypothetical protein